MKAIENYREKVNSALKEFLEKKAKEDGEYSEQTRELIENILEYNMRGGKRIRPLVIIFAYRCFKNDNEKAIINASIAIELMQAYLLIHDDIMDNSDLRRGKLSMHRIYSSLGEGFGKSTAILAGNLCLSYAYESIIEADFSTEEKIGALRWVCWINRRENYGQALDIIPGFFGLKEEDVMRIYELKTATYTVQGPIYLGGALAGASVEEIDKLQKYGFNLGVAFQIQDDINGIFASVEEMGKPNDSDIKEGKKTLLIAKSLESAGEDDRKFLLENYGKKDVCESEIDRIKEIIRKNSLDYCVNKVKSLIEEGKKSLEGLNLRDEGKNFLLEMADYVSSLA